MNDKARIIRASEVFDQTGISIREWQKNTGEILIKGDHIKKIYICPSKEKIHSNISIRIDSMFNGYELFDEIKKTKRKKYSIIISIDESYWGPRGNRLYGGK
jgi:tRNA A37 N6-isopentenylltransferase MiaA